MTTWNDARQGVSRRTFLQLAGLLVSNAVIKYIPSSTNTSGTPLRDYADKIVTSSGKSFKIGINLESGDWEDPTGTPKQLAVQQFNQIVNPSIWMPDAYIGPEHWDFSVSDSFLQKAQAANQSTIGMHLVYGSWALSIKAVPSWIINGGYSREQLITIMENHIVAVMSRYRGQISAYSVVNEYYNNNGENDWWYQTIGPDYLRIAFQKARETDPDAILIYNDFSNETKSGGNYNLTKTNVDYLNSLGLIDAVGLQMHLFGDRPTKTDVIDAMQSYGIPVWVTEFDSFQFSELPNPAQEQADITQAMIEAALESGKCDCFTAWGISDKHSSWNIYFEGDFNPCLWDNNYDPKPNYYALQQVLGANVTLPPTVTPTLIPTSVAPTPSPSATRPFSIYLPNAQR